MIIEPKNKKEEARNNDGWSGYVCVCGPLPRKSKKLSIHLRAHCLFSNKLYFVCCKASGSINKKYILPYLPLAFKVRDSCDGNGWNKWHICKRWQPLFGLKSEHIAKSLVFEKTHCTIGVSKCSTTDFLSFTLQVLRYTFGHGTKHARFCRLFRLLFVVMVTLDEWIRINVNLSRMYH